MTNVELDPPAFWVFAYPSSYGILKRHSRTPEERTCIRSILHEIRADARLLLKF
jgi:hypothetical protein